MPRIRTIKPEFWSDEKVAKLTMLERLVFIGTWNYADDAGRARYTAKGMNGFLFPLDNVSDKQVSDAMQHLHDMRMLTLYDVDEVPHYQITNWDKHQRINRASCSVIPPPKNAQEPIEHVVSDHGSLSEQSLSKCIGSKEHGTGSKEHVSPQTQSAGLLFSRFWSAYPKKVDKQEAMRLFNAMNPDEDLLSKLLAAIDTAKKSVQWREVQFVPSPAKWLRREKWQDELPIEGESAGNNGHKPDLTPKFPIFDGKTMRSAT